MKIWIIYHFIQMHKLDTFVFPATLKKLTARVVNSWLSTFMVVFSFGAKVRLSDGKKRFVKILFTGDDGRLSVCECALSRFCKRSEAPRQLWFLLCSITSRLSHRCISCVFSLPVTTSSLERLQRQSDDPWHTAVEWLILQAHQTVEGQRSSPHCGSNPCLIKASIILWAQIN